MAATKKTRSRKSKKADVTAIPQHDAEGKLRVVIETPKGSRNKYAFDSEEEIFVLKKVLPAGMTFPFDFGFIPSTQAQDGDPIDVLLLMDEAAFPGCTVRARLVGVIKAEEAEEGKKLRNDRLIAVAESSPSYSEMRSLTDLGERLVKDIEQFLGTYQKLEEREFKLIGRGNAQEATRLVSEASSNSRRIKRRAA